MSPLPSDSNSPAPATIPFAFGKNWARFLEGLTEPRIQAAEESLQRLLAKESLSNCQFLDAGSGSGLFSLAARRLGAAVTSLDVDADSVACANHLRQQFPGEASHWQVVQGSLLDAPLLESLGQFEVVYCWGVAHHTGKMWQAIANLVDRVKPQGTLVLAIYNDQQYLSRGWMAVKHGYQRLPSWLRPLYVAAIGSVLFVQRLAATLAAGLARLVTLRNPFVPAVNWARETQARGMHRWHDLVDWVGGWPFEVARPEEIFRFLRDRGFRLQELTTSSGHGCNEFVFVRDR